MFLTENSGTGMSNLEPIEQRNRSYFIRIQTAIICSLLLFILLFRYWPGSWSNDKTLPNRFTGEVVITPEMIIASEQVTVEHIPPPVPRPENTLQEEEVRDMTYDLELDVSGGLEEPLSYFEPDDDNHVVEQPDQPPSVRRIVEPVMPPEARSEGIRVELEVLFTVSVEGMVEEATVTSLRLYNRHTGQFELVEETGYGFREIALRAARQWLFHPAQHEGEPVRSQTRHQFTFGERFMKKPDG